MPPPSKTIVIDTGLTPSPEVEPEYAEKGILPQFMNAPPIKKPACPPGEGLPGRILMYTSPEDGRQVYRQRFGQNGLISAIWEAYCHHRHLSLSPDHVWLALVTSFSLWMNTGDNAEVVRKEFVEHEDKMMLEICVPGSLYSVDWNGIIRKFSDMVDENTVNDAREWLEPNFSTTTFRAKTVGKVSMMGTFQKFFEYRCCLMCGIPSVTLEGTLADWEAVREKAKRFATLGVPDLTDWATKVDDVLERFVSSYKGEEQTDFWQKICSQQGGGSGPSYIAGWACVFMPFIVTNEMSIVFDNPDDPKIPRRVTTDTYKYTLRGYDLNKFWAVRKPERLEDDMDINSEESRQYYQSLSQYHQAWPQIETGQVPPAMVECPLSINDNGREYSTFLYAGLFTNTYDASTNTVRPSIDWAMVDITPGEFVEGTPVEMSV